MGNSHVSAYKHEKMSTKRARLLNPFWKLFYWYISSLDRNGEVTLLNYGYADNQKIELKKEDESNRYPIQLYNHVVASIQLKGLDILEVGCGRGGGASYIARYFAPKSVRGIDLCRKAIDFCNKHYSIRELSFCCGDASHLPCSDNNFDAVVNVESSHRYSDMGRFLKEVYRVLKPKGYLLFADLRDGESIKSLKSQLNSSELKVIKEEVITGGVIKALELDHERRMDLINRLAPAFLHRLTKEFAGTKGTDVYKSFISKKREYFHYILQKV